LEGVRYAVGKSYYGRFYPPANAYALVVGDVEPERAASLVVETLGSWQGFAHRAEGFPPPPKVAADRVFSFRTLIEQVYYALGVLTPGHAAPDHVATELLRRVLGEGKTSRLYRRLVEQEGLTTQFLTGKYDLSNLGIFAVGGAVDPDRADRFKAILQEEFARISREPVTPDELQLARRLFSADLVREFETNEGIASFRSERL